MHTNNKRFDLGKKTKQKENEFYSISQFARLMQIYFVMKIIREFVVGVCVCVWV